MNGKHDHTTAVCVSLRLLNVIPRTPNQLVYEETGRYPLYICSYTTCIKYWLNVLRMQADRLPVKSYKMLHNMHGNNKKTTGPPLLALHCTDRVLDTFGKNQGVCGVRSFLCEFRQSLIDCYFHGWNSDINPKDRYTFFPLRLNKHTDYLNICLLSNKKKFF